MSSEYIPCYANHVIEYVQQIKEMYIEMQLATSLLSGGSDTESPGIGIAVLRGDCILSSDRE